MLTGITPPEPLQILSIGFKKPIDLNPGLSEILNDVIIKGMAVRATERFQNVLEIQNNLKTNKSNGKANNTSSFSETIIDKRISTKLKKYDYLDSFFEGLAVVKLNSKYGFIDKTGQEVITCKYDYASDFSGGVAEVKLNDKYGLIDKTGVEVVPCDYEYIIKKDGFILVVHKNKGKFIYIIGSGLVHCKYDEVRSPEEGLACVKLNGKYGFIDKIGQEVIPCKYDNADSFSEGLAAVKTNEGKGYIDRYGRVKIQFKYTTALEFSQGLALVSFFGKDFEIKSGFININGELVIKFNNDFSEVWSNNSAFNDGFLKLGFVKGFFTKEIKYGAINTDGKEIIPFKFNTTEEVDNALESLESTFNRTNVIDGKMYLLDKNNRKITTLPLKEFQLSEDIYFTLDIIEEKMISIVNKHGHEVLPLRYKQIDTFIEGLAAAVNNNGKIGFIDKIGKEVIPCIFDSTNGFSDGLAQVELNGKICFINKQGNVVLE